MKYANLCRMVPKIRTIMIPATKFNVATINKPLSVLVINIIIGKIFKNDNVSFLTKNKRSDDIG